MLDVVHLGRVADPAGFVVPQHRVGLDRVPQRPADVDKLFHPVVALVVADEVVIAVIGVVRAAGRGDDVERDPPARHMVERVEQPGQVIRVHEGRRIGDTEAEMLRHPRHRHRERRQILAWPRDAPAHRRVAALLPGARHAGSIAREQHVEKAALGDAGDLLERPDVGVGVFGPGARYSPTPLHVDVREVEGEVHPLRHVSNPLFGDRALAGDRTAAQRAGARIAPLHGVAFRQRPGEGC